jgi:hypothetical protein
LEGVTIVSNKVEMYIRPVIHGNQVVSIEIHDISLPLREPIPVAKLAELVEVIERFAKYIDIEKLSEVLPKESLKKWVPQDLRKFILTDIRDDQAIALKVLVETTEISREEFIQKMAKLLGEQGFRGWDLGGILAGITMKAKNWGYESPYKSEWRSVGKEWKCFYSIARDEYKDIIASALKEREER